MYQQTKQLLVFYSVQSFLNGNSIYEVITAYISFILHADAVITNKNNFVTFSFSHCEFTEISSSKVCTSKLAIELER